MKNFEIYDSGRREDCGWILIDQKRVAHGPDLFIPTGSKLIMEVDPNSNKIQFTNFHNGKLWSFKLTPNFMQKRMFVYAYMGNPGDCI